MKDTPLKTQLSFKKISKFKNISCQICFRSQISKFGLYSTNMAWIRLIFVVFCIGSIHGLPQDITNPCNDSKLCDLTKNLIENPSLVDSKPSDMVDIVIFALKMALEFISNVANCYFRPSQQVDDAILGHCYDWNWEAFEYIIFSFFTQLTIAMLHNGLLLPIESLWGNFVVTVVGVGALYDLQA